MTYDAIAISIQTFTNGSYLNTKSSPSNSVLPINKPPISLTDLQNQKPNTNTSTHSSTPSILYTRKQRSSKSSKMSAPNSGRQSPPPERQTGSQQQDPVASGHTQHGIHGDSKGASEDTKFHGLESNPKHPLEDIEAKKFTKGPGN
ncbi:hypothetical protein BDV38DRAFT_285354 [Aspergillus pseudotamarii]|uniref:Uncharacterized protein n=1 Tax=Aspergillus pseudotamarii TaxID=132259 RepID=A0A5N6SMH4_ASPPS|nr:uncharacterized protein BDV38DRAFT_285354 [Aspergillus pseudotamarii]KAE8134970.1 hypothetical protein BDV38DRAFT_285354 [Aspergillus pseudotamarii]